MTRIDIINKFIDKYGYKSYIEIGTQKGVSFDGIRCDNKIGVDPDPNAKADYQMTSDKFFKGMSRKAETDIFFIDGMHEAEQVYKDILNALDHLSEGGTIICHDMLPLSDEMQRVPRETKIWTGNCWKAFVRLRMERDDLEMYVIDADWGCGVIRKGKQDKLSITEEITYENFGKNRKEWMNIITTQEFLNKMGDRVGNYKVWEFIPYSIDKALGVAYNECFDLVPSDDDWVILTDADSLYLTPSHIHMVRRAIDKYPDAGMFVCKVNRVKRKAQVYDMKLFEDMDIKKHRRIALDLASKPLDCPEIGGDLGGYFMCLKKSTWKDMGGFKTTGILGVDTMASRRIREIGKVTRIINNLYKFHYYRWLEGINSKEHLK